MAGTLESYFVSIGVKGQQAVLKTIDKVKKESKSLTKIKAKLNLEARNINKAVSGKSSPSSTAPVETTPSSEQKKSDKKEEQNANKYKDAARMVGGAMNKFASSAASLDPVSAVQGAMSAVAKVGSGVAGMIPMVGQGLSTAIQGLSDASNMAVGMAKSSLDMAKQATAGQYNLEQRNAAVSYYGGGDNNQEAEKAGLANSEYANLMMKVSSSNGRLDKSLKDMIAELAKTKDVSALGAAASGNFESTGTDKGWMMQQLMNSVGNIPPSLKNKLMTSLLPQMSGEIMSNEGEGSRKVAAAYSNAEEAQTTRLYNTALQADMVSLNNSFNNLQATLLSVGAGFAGYTNTMTKAVNSFASDLASAGAAVKSVKDKFGK